jgi:hypothetical protein
MPPELSIVKVDKRKYRTIARENWGLTKEQMKGMHVHHRIPVSKNGTNDPSNLYVCTADYHDNVWHGGDGSFIGLATEGGSKGGTRAAELGVGIHAPEMRGVGGKKSAELGVGVHGRPAEQIKEDGRKGGKKAAELGVGIHGRTPEQMTEDGKEGGRKGGAKAAELGVGVHAPGKRSEGGKKAAEWGLGIHAPGKQSKGGKTTADQKWQSTDPNHPPFIANPGNLARWQKARGIDTSLRVKLQ